MVNAGNFYGVVEMLDDFGVVHPRKLALRDELAGDLVTLEELTCFIAAAAATLADL